MGKMNMINYISQMELNRKIMQPETGYVTQTKIDIKKNWIHRAVTNVL